MKSTIVSFKSPEYVIGYISLRVLHICKTNVVIYMHIVLHLLSINLLELLLLLLATIVSLMKIFKLVIVFYLFLITSQCPTFYQIA